MVCGRFTPLELERALQNRFWLPLHRRQPPPPSSFEPLLDHELTDSPSPPCHAEKGGLRQDVDRVATHNFTSYSINTVKDFGVLSFLSYSSADRWGCVCGQGKESGGSPWRKRCQGEKIQRTCIFQWHSIICTMFSSNYCFLSFLMTKYSQADVKAKNKRERKVCYLTHLQAFRTAAVSHYFK